MTELACKTCNGDGEVECPKCKGAGTLPAECRECKGGGKIPDAAGKMVECDICNGRGIVDNQCEECYGGGKVACDVCGGTG